MSVRPWTCLHIDELRSGVRDLDIARLSRETIAQALANNLIPLKTLITDCIPRAASEIKSSPNRVQKRIDILLDSRPESLALLELLSEAIKIKLESSFALSDLKRWLVEISLSCPHLHEGYTFHRSVWLSLANLVTPFLKELIIKCDQDAGLDFLSTG